jgi:hypothetical protein
VFSYNPQVQVTFHCRRRGFGVFFPVRICLDVMWREVCKTRVSYYQIRCLGNGNLNTLPIICVGLSGMDLQVLLLFVPLLLNSSDTGNEWSWLKLHRCRRSSQVGSSRPLLSFRLSLPSSFIFYRSLLIILSTLP